MDKIYKDAKDVPVAATIIYSDGTTDGAFTTPECTDRFTMNELKDAFLKGAVIFNTDQEWYTKVLGYVESSGQGYVTYIAPITSSTTTPFVGCLASDEADNS